MWTKKIGQFYFGQSVRKLPENKEKMLFYGTYFEKSIINRKPLIWSHDKIVMKFGEKNGRVVFWAKCTKTARKSRKNVILQSLLRTR